MVALDCQKSRKQSKAAGLQEETSDHVRKADVDTVDTGDSGIEEVAYKAQMVHQGLVHMRQRQVAGSPESRAEVGHQDVAAAGAKVGSIHCLCGDCPWDPRVGRGRIHNHCLVCLESLRAWGS